MAVGVKKIRKELKKLSEKNMTRLPARKGYFPVYVGEEHKKYVVPISCLSSIMFKALLNQFEDENQFAGDPISLPCSIGMFEAVLNIAKAEKSSHDKNTDK